MTATQERIIGLAEATESYIQQVHSQQEQTGHSSYTAQQKHDHEQHLARKSMDAQSNGGGS